MTNILRVQKADNGYLVTNMKTNQTYLCMTEDDVLNKTKEILSEKSIEEKK